MVEEMLKTSTQVVQAPFSIRRFYEPIFGTFAVTGETPILLIQSRLTSLGMISFIK
jgi:hypothetical protein